MARDRKRRRQRRPRPGGPAQSSAQAAASTPVAADPAAVEDMPEAREVELAQAPDPIDDPTADPALAAAAEPDFDEPVRPVVRPSDYDDEQDESLAGGAVAGVRAQRAPARPAKGNRVTGFLRASWAELQRVQWPNRQQVFQATAVVLGFVVVAGAYLAGADYVAGKIVDAIL